MRNRIVLAFLLAGISPASAHVTLAEADAKGGSHFIATFRVGHGCSGSPTTALRIDIPPAIVMARPQPKPGWSLAIDHAPLSVAQTGDMGEKITSRVSAITWKGATLPADEFDTFSIMVKLPKDAARLAFAATQTCKSGVEHWAGGDAAHPAPVLTVTQGAAADTMPGMTMGGMTAHETAKAAPVTVTGGWIRALPPGVPSGGYFTLHNNSGAPVVLTGAQSAACGMLMLHKSETGSGMARMTDVVRIAVPAHGTLQFAPGGYHLMCMNAKPAIKPGNTVDVTLAFADRSAITAKFNVRRAGAR